MTAVKLNTIAQALAFAKNEWQHGKPVWQGQCQHFTRTCFGAPTWADSALHAWQKIPAVDKHHTLFADVPAGAAMYFDFAPFGHAMIAGQVNAYSTDYMRRGHIDPVPRDLPHWNGQHHFLGWSYWTPFGLLGGGKA